MVGTERRLTELRLQIGDATRTNFSISEVTRALRVWRQVDAFFSGATKPDILFDSVFDKVGEIHIDASPTVDYFRILHEAVRTPARKRESRESFKSLFHSRPER